MTSPRNRSHAIALPRPAALGQLLPLAALAGALMLAAPAFADQPAHAQGRGNGNGNGHSVSVSQRAGCPPGLAKKGNGCQPPGQATKTWGDPANIIVGEIYEPSVVHIITSPGRYGLSQPMQGSVYAVVGNRLVRLDERTQAVLSIIRIVDAILD